MAAVRIKIRLVSTGTKQDGKKTGYFYTTFKNPRNTTDKIILKKFDPRAWNSVTGKTGMMVDFKEEKIK